MGRYSLRPRKNRSSAIPPDTPSPPPSPKPRKRATRRRANNKRAHRHTPPADSRNDADQVPDPPYVARDDDDIVGAAQTDDVQAVMGNSAQVELSDEARKSAVLEEPGSENNHADDRPHPAQEPPQLGVDAAAAEQERGSGQVDDAVEAEKSGSADDDAPDDNEQSSSEEDDDAADAEFEAAALADAEKARDADFVPDYDEEEDEADDDSAVVHSSPPASPPGEWDQSPPPSHEQKRKRKAKSKTTTKRKKTAKKDSGGVHADDATVERLFRALDAAENGRIRALDIQRVADDHGQFYTADELRDMVRFWDTSGTGTVDLPTFRVLVRDAGF